MYKIILVDDEILVRSAIRENMDWASLDCQLVGDFSNGQEACEYIRQNPVDIVLTDILMPYMDGMELSHFLHDHYPEIVIVIFSGFGEFEYAKKAIQYNVSEYLLKPITALELSDIIRKMETIVDERRLEHRKLEQLKIYSTKYRENALAIRSREIDALVSGSRDFNKTIQTLKERGIEFHSKEYRIAILQLDIMTDYDNLEAKSRQDSDLMSFGLFNISQEIVTRENAGIVYQTGRARTGIIFEGNDLMEESARIRLIISEIKRNLKDLLGMDVSAGIGTTVASAQDLIHSYSDALRCFNYRYLFGDNLLLDAAEIHKSQELNIQDALKELSQAIKAGRKESMNLILARIGEDIRNSYMEKSRACSYLQHIAREVSDISITLLHEDSANVSARVEDLMNQVIDQDNFPAALSLVKEYAQSVYEEVSSQSSSSGQRQALLALDYIRNNYMDNELSLNKICRYLSISTSYFSTIFKEMTGETFMEVLIRTRMEKAKELLKTTSLKNYEIAEKVGFSDPHYFGISFKKMTGQTPTEYARSHRA